MGGKHDSHCPKKEKKHKKVTVSECIHSLKFKIYRQVKSHDTSKTICKSRGNLTANEMLNKPYV